MFINDFANVGVILSWKISLYLPLTRNFWAGEAEGLAVKM